MPGSPVCNVCGTDGGSEYELRLYMTEGGHRDITIRLCDPCAEAHLEADIVEQLQPPA